MIEWLNANEGAVMGLATVALVVVTAVYVWLTQRMLRIARQATSGADLSIVALTDAGKSSFGTSEERHCLELHVTNSGAGPAWDLEPRLRIRAGRRSRDLELTYIRDGPDEFVGTAVAMEPTNQPKGRYVGEGSVTLIGSSLEDVFTFKGPEGWEPSAEQVNVEASIRWRDSTGRRHTRRAIRLALKDAASFR